MATLASIRASEMSLSLSDRWNEWWEIHSRDLGASSTSEELWTLPLRFVERVVRGSLQKEGFSVPATRELQAVLERGLDPLSESECPKSHKL